MDARTLGLAVVVCGVAAIAAGAAIYLGWFSWFGHLPGDIRIERPNVRLFVPVTSMVLVSIVLTLALHLLRRLF